jgi:hypothetical protein
MKCVSRWLCIRLSGLGYPLSRAMTLSCLLTTEKAPDVAPDITFESMFDGAHAPVTTDVLSENRLEFHSHPLKSTHRTPVH